MNGDRSLEKPNRIPQIYGYTVCLIAVAALLQAWRRLVGSGLTMLIAIALFTWHWSWLRARMAEERAASDRRA